MKKIQQALFSLTLLATVGCDDSVSNVAHIANLHQQTDCLGTYTTVELSTSNPVITLGNNGEFQARLAGQPPENESVQFAWKICPSNSVSLNTKIRDSDGNEVRLRPSGPILLIRRQKGTGDVHPAAIFEIIPNSPQHRAANSVWMVKGGIIGPLPIVKKGSNHVVVLPHQNSAVARQQEATTPRATVASVTGTIINRAEEPGVDLDFDLDTDLNLDLGSTSDTSSTETSSTGTTKNQQKSSGDEGIFSRLKGYASQLGQGLSNALSGVGDLINEVTEEFSKNPETLNFVTERVIPAAINIGLGVTFIQSGNAIAGAASLTQGIGTLLNDQEGVDNAVNQAGEVVDSVCKQVGLALDNATPEIAKQVCRDRGVILSIKMDPESTVIQQQVLTLCGNLFAPMKEKDKSGMFAGVADNMCSSYSQSVDQSCKQMILKSTEEQLSEYSPKDPFLSGSQPSFSEKCPPTSSFTNLVTSDGIE